MAATRCWSARDDPESLTEAILRVIDDPDLAMKLVAEGRRRILSGFTEERSANACKRLVEDLLRRRGQPVGVTR
jgi:hypothetical protein